MDDTVRLTTISTLKAESSYKADSQPKAVATHKGTSVVGTTDSLVVLDGTKKVFSLPVKYQPMSVAISVDGTEVSVGTDVFSFFPFPFFFFFFKKNLIF